MESLRGIFAQSQPPPKRDFLRENVMRIKKMQRKTQQPRTEYNSKFNRPVVPKSRKFSFCESNLNQNHRSTHSLSLCSIKPPLNHLRKSVSSIILCQQKDTATQTLDINDEYFLKDSIIRYPSASTVRSQRQSSQPVQTCSRGHLMEEEMPRQRFKGHFHDRNDEHCEKMERHISELSEYLDKGSISKKSPSILKNASSKSILKSSKNYINESQRREDKGQKLSDASNDPAMVVISDDDESNENKDDGSKELSGEGDVASSAAKKLQLKAAEQDPDCPEGHVPLSENERLEALKIAKKREATKPQKPFLIT